MERLNKTPAEAAKAPTKPSPVKAMIAWLVETDREFRVAQSMVDKTRQRF
ncbi:hypothetical protein KX928_04700 [Roseobacter sp. YSTF-M11]|uniref:Uncharacterized protein n=1 Tax=Roseobacter insulae TaxID=2859783 RepID=A0A9X1K120_9RHOB|nr:hypothetical protein [Roseobacter insulae]MBW4707083.1 hypothetical protein [Roseobacter insulae]